MPAGLLEFLHQQSNGIHLSLVISEEDGCNQSCPLCFIDQNGELQWVPGLPQWTEHDLVAWLEQTCALIRVASLRIQGHEITTSTWYKYRAVLEPAYRCGIEQLGLITNCVEIGLDPIIAKTLAGYNVHVVASLDSTELTVMDKVRLAGQYERFGDRVAPNHPDPDVLSFFYDGLEHLVRAYGDRASDQISIHSVLWQPNALERVDTIPEVLPDYGLNRWMISRMLGVQLKPTHSDELFLGGIKQLLPIAKDSGVELTVGNDAYGFSQKVRHAKAYRHIPFYTPEGTTDQPLIVTRLADRTGYLRTSLPDVFRKVEFGGWTPVLQPGDSSGKDFVSQLLLDQPQAARYLSQPDERLRPAWMITRKPSSDSLRA